MTTAPRLVPLALLCLGLLLVGLPLGVGKPGLPLTYKADEPAYYLMALSLMRDGDLECNLEDRERAVVEFPHLPADNLIVMTDDGWRTVYFGKPYLYSLLAAPLTHWFGADGMFAFNALLFMAMVAMGTAYLRRFNPEGLAALFAIGFFALSALFVYIFWLHPEILMATGICACLYFGLTEGEPGPRTRGWWRRIRGAAARPAVRLSLSAAALAAASYHKPMLALMGVPVLVAVARRSGWRRAAAWIVAAAVAMGVLAGVAVALTGHPSAYLGVQRTGIRVGNPEVVPFTPQSGEELERLKTDKSWSWLWRLPEFKPRKTLIAAGEFLWGRHTGLVPYLPFALIALLLFLLHERRDGVRWSIVAAVTAIAAFFLIWIPFNWHGGSGFVGNRYFVTVYPAFLFLVGRVRPAWILAPAYAFGGLVLGVVVFHPFGLPVREPTLQAHVRGRAFDWFPVETTLQNIPGYRGVVIEGVWFRFRKDVARLRGDEFWFYGHLDSETWMVHPTPIDEPVLFEVRSLAADNVVELGIGEQQLTLLFERDNVEDDIQIIELQPNDPDLYRPVRIVPDDDPPGYLYRLRVHPHTGKVPRDGRGNIVENYFLGAGVRYLGPRSKVYADEAFAIEWLDCEAPAIVAAGDTFRSEVRFRNAGVLRWPRDGLTRVALSYHWAQDGEIAIFEGSRTRLPGDVDPGAESGASMRIEAPTAPGTYELWIDPVREGIAWFSTRNDETYCRATVEVVAPS